MMRLCEKLFYTAPYFTIAIRRRKDQLIFQQKFYADYTVLSDQYHWCADPILIEHHDKTYLFYEAVEGLHGHIEVAEVNDDCSLSQSVRIFSDLCHRSYPFVFQINDQWYMIPETLELNEVILYKATAFPYEWVQKEVLLKGEYVDSTVFQKKGHLYLLTYEFNGKNEAVNPKAYQLIFNENNDSCMISIPWNSFDGLLSRGAGPVISSHDKLYRPAQINRETAYGDGLVFYEIEQCDKMYKEREVFRVLPKQIKLSKYHFDGLHTYSSTSKFEAIDVRCRDFNIFKIFERMRRRWK